MFIDYFKFKEAVANCIIVVELSLGQTYGHIRIFVTLGKVCFAGEIETTQLVDFKRISSKYLKLF